MIAQDNGDRLARRREVLLQARCRKSQWHVFAVELGDVSQGGCSIVGSAESFEVGELIQLRIPNFISLDAEVRWIDGECVGVEFREALNSRAIEDLSAIYGLTIAPSPWRV